MSISPTARRAAIVPAALLAAQAAWGHALPCTDFGQLSQALLQVHGEAPAIWLRAGAGAEQLVIFIDPADRSWTAALVHGDLACVVAVGAGVGFGEAL